MDDSGHGESLESLFTNTEYVERDVETGRGTKHPHTIRLKVLDAASTDHDLTGQIVWPGARLLADYLSSLSEEKTFGKTACEIGAGAGLAGLVCAQFCNTTLTDYNSVVLELLKQNAVLNNCTHQMRCVEMDWEKEQDVALVRSMSPNSQGYDLVLGADICYGLKAVPYIFKTFAALMRHDKNSLGLLGYVSRAAAIDRALETAAIDVGLAIEMSGPFKNVGGGLQGTVYRLKWPEEKKNYPNKILKHCGGSSVSVAVIAISLVLTLQFSRQRARQRLRTSKK